MLFPDDHHYSLTAMADDEGNFVQFYFDIVFKNELNEDGIPGFDDLFLDVVFTKNDSILLDEEDLSAALREGLVDPDTADLAYFTAMKILNETEGHYEDLCHWISTCVSYLD
jgi:predicted RNA-binding protein associated with RNAse of E/G family